MVPAALPEAIMTIFANQYALYPTPSSLSQGGINIVVPPVRGFKNKLNVYLREVSKKPAAACSSTG